MRNYAYIKPKLNLVSQYSIVKKWITDRIVKNKNIILVVNGPTGSGKSWTSLALAEDLAQDTETEFSVKRNIAFKFEDTLKNMQKNEDKPGTVYIMEEVGATSSGSSAREWQSKSNILFNSFMQTNRCKQQILILNCPSFYNLDKGTRQLVHFQLESVGINYHTKCGLFKPFMIQCNSRKGKLYFKYLKYKDQYGMKKKIRKVNIPKPSQNLIESYETAKNKYVNDLNAHLLTTMTDKETRANKKKTELGNRQKATKELIEKGMKPQEIADLLNISLKSVYNHKNVLQT